jgi:hypothetical protein
LDEAVEALRARADVGDEHAAVRLAYLLAEQFYRSLDHHGQNSRHIARALSEAVRDLRYRYPDRPGLWAPYIHIGP